MYIYYIPIRPVVNQQFASGAPWRFAANHCLHFASLKQRTLLRRIGPDKGGHWEILRSKKKNPS